MKIYFGRLMLSLILLVGSVSACAPKVKLVDGTKTPVLLNPRIIQQDTLWRGVIKVQGVIEVAKEATLTIAPGTRVHFNWLDTDNDKIGESGLRVRGRLLAEGTIRKPIVFTSLNKEERSAWGEVRLEEAGPSRLRYCYFSFADWGLHMHFSPVIIEHCRFENSEGGLRFRSGPIDIHNCLIQKNEIGIRYLLSNPKIQHNTIRKNTHGIFIREGSKKPIISHNNIYNNKRYNLKLGEAQTTDISCPENFWGTTDQAVIDKKIFDHQESNYLGKVNYQPIAEMPWGISWGQ